MERRELDGQPIRTRDVTLRLWVGNWKEIWPPASEAESDISWWMMLLVYWWSVCLNSQGIYHTSLNELKGPFTLSINDQFGASASIPASYLISLVATHFSSNSMGLLRNLSNFNGSDIARDITAWTLMLYVNGALVLLGLMCITFLVCREEFMSFQWVLIILQHDRTDRLIAHLLVNIAKLHHRY